MKKNIIPFYFQNLQTYIIVLKVTAWFYIYDGLIFNEY